MTQAPTPTLDPALTPAMADVLRRIARANRPHVSTLSPQQVRDGYAAGCDVLEIERPQLAHIQDFHIPARDGFALPARLYAAKKPKPKSKPGQGLPTLLYLHGGGFTIGSIETHDILCRSLASQAGCAVVALDYRLAPEYRFPTAVNDAWDSLQWLAHSEEGRALGIDPQRLAVGGDSAGGTLAAVCALLARDAGLPLALQLLIYPGTCAHQDTDSHQRYEQGYLLDKRSIDWFFGLYLNTPQEREDWRFAPLLAQDFQQLAPAHLFLAELDALVDEGLAYADALRMAGVLVDLDIYQGVTHEFIKMGRVLPEAVQVQKDIAQALEAAFSN